MHRGLRRLGRQLPLLSLSRLLISAIPPPTTAFAQPTPHTLGLRGASMQAGGTCEGEGPVGRVAVVGAGIAGSCLARGLREAGASVTVFEMGRGAGGRMSTRKTRELPGLSVNHGVPVFTASDKAFVDMLSPLIERGVVAEWEGKRFELDAALGTMIERQLPGKGYVGSPDMSSVCAHLLEGIETRYQSQVAGVKAEEGGGWSLVGPKEEDFGRFDWLCVTSHTMGHSRWQAVFGSPPPLQAALAGAPDLAPLVAPLEGVSSSPVMIAMVSFKADTPAAEALTKLPFALADVSHHDKIARLVRQESDGYVSLVVHSTHDYAAARANVYGSTSAAAKLAPELWTKEKAKKGEAEVLQDLYTAATQLLEPHTGPLSEPVWGPLLHRWGSAFCGPSAVPLPAISPSRRLALCGDFAGSSRPDTYAGVEAAALSGIDLAKAIAASSKAKI